MNRQLRRPDLTWATMDHNVSTTNQGHRRLRRDGPHPDGDTRRQLQGVRGSSTT
ncbi:hypothetical protein ACLK2G_00375 [Escherichia coli]